MLFEINDEVWEDLWGEAKLKKQDGWMDTETDEIDWATLPHIGKLWCCSTPLKDGLSIEIQNYEMTEDLLLLSKDEGEENTRATLAFFLSGKVQTNLPGLTGESDEIVGHHYLENTVGINETEKWLAGEPFLRIYINIDPLQIFSDLEANQQAQLLPELQQTLEGNHHPYHRVGVTTAEMHRVLRQILYCPYQGLLKRIYLQGKAWELIALQFEQFQSENQLVGQLTPSEVERIHYAKDILIRQLDNPPSLMELAKQAGINDFALKQGFRQVFGTTVFRYLHDYRLDVARRLLATHDRGIQNIAQTVGFANRGYFAAAFRKKFGISPKAYQLQQKNSASRSKNSVWGSF
jgi:AraC family transcriptional regulator, transcriptional activator of the genes for pyochelin and ferripyochelin receptors